MLDWQRSTGNLHHFLPMLWVLKCFPKWFRQTQLRKPKLRNQVGVRFSPFSFLYTIAFLSEENLATESEGNGSLCSYSLRFAQSTALGCMIKVLTGDGFYFSFWLLKVQKLKFLCLLYLMLVNKLLYLQSQNSQLYFLDAPEASVTVTDTGSDKSEIQVKPAPAESSYSCSAVNCNFLAESECNIAEWYIWSCIEQDRS